MLRKVECGTSFIYLRYKFLCFSKHIRVFKISVGGDFPVAMRFSKDFPEQKSGATIAMEYAMTWATGYINWKDVGAYVIIRRLTVFM